MGASALHGPHQVAVKSTRTGTPAFSTSVSKLRSLNTCIFSAAMGFSRGPHNIMPVRARAIARRLSATVPPPMQPRDRRHDSPFLTPGRPALPPGWTSDGVANVLEPLSEERRRSRLTSVIDARVGSVTLLMDAPQDPHNAAAALRSADAFGLPEL